MWSEKFLHLFNAFHPSQIFMSSRYLQIDSTGTGTGYYLSNDLFVVKLTPL